jgi:hypothetical protein
MWTSVSCQKFHNANKLGRLFQINAPAVVQQVVDTDVDVSQAVRSSMAMGLPPSCTLSHSHNVSASTAAHEFTVLFDARSSPSDSAYTNVNGIVACYNYLRGLGTQNCRISGPGAPITQFCRSGDAHVTGQSISDRDESSYW